MQKNHNKIKHPIGFHVCCITFLCERLAYYGAKPILLLFLITSVGQGGLEISATEATVLTANLIAYTAIAPIIGGVVSDRWIGARYSVTLGMGLMAIGYGVGWLADNASMINGMILLISVGTGLFKGNLNALIGCQYPAKIKLDGAFSLQYSYINVGTFLGSLLSGYLYLHVFRNGDIFGFRQCFLVSALFCAVGAVWFVGNWGQLQGQGKKPYKDLNKGSNQLTKIEMQHIVAIIIVATLAVVFWIFYFQQDLAIVLYMTDYVDMSIGDFILPISWITTSWNGLLCIILGGVMAKVWKRLATRPQGDANIFCKIGWSFGFLGLGFGMMAICEYVRGLSGVSDSKVSFLWPFLFVTCITIGEMCFSPLRNAFVSRYAPKKYLGLLMGVIASSSFFANKVSPYVQVVIAEFDVYTVFKAIFIILMVIAAVILLLNKTINKLVEQ